MPTYQYRCTDCGRDLEIFQRFSDDALTVCPTCHGSLRKVFSAVGVVFKGSGFYSTDNHTSGAAKAAVASSDSSDGSSTTSSSPSTSSTASQSSSASSPAKAAAN
ncbi:FmdB family zinc ribbon protein [Acidipropionibacterium timonense]|uniref:FmdB family zinc ribbon protein n=1 Tax=Acidipropionibacterium timonense TaxID=2161818 RepID=UPI00103154D2|nr:FmdB family zinc ribbon protein [Acidipropionibacterium timonense]